MRLCSLATAIGLFLALPAFAAMPRTIGFMGVLSDSTGARLSGAHTVKLSLYSAPTGGASLWTDTKSVTATNGLFSTVLGDTASDPFPPSLNFDQPLFVGITVASETTEMTPRIPLQGVPYALMAEAVPDASISSAKLASDRASLSKITAGALSVGTGNVVQAASAIGIGTRPDRPLTLLGSGQSGEWLSLQDTSGATKWHLNNRSGGLNFAESGVSDNRLFLKPGGPVGIGTDTPSGALEVLSHPTLAAGVVTDQAVTGPAYYWLTPNTTTVGTGQSFQAGVNGSLTRLQLLIGSWNATAWKADLKIYDGEGVNGTLLSTISISGDSSSPTWRTYTLPTPVSVTNGHMYTWMVSVTSPGATVAIGMAEQDIYPRGMVWASNNTNVPGWDAYFYTIVSVPAGPNVAHSLVVRDDTGNVGIGTQDPSYTLHVNGSVAGVGNYVNLSDARLKTDLSPISNPLGIVESLRGVTFDWKQDAGVPWHLPAGRHVGLLAQDVEKVLPEAVSRDRAGYRSVAYSALVPVLVEAVKTQQREMAVLSARNRSLEERLHRLERRNGGRR